jgi:hypothetical protein
MRKSPLLAAAAVAALTLTAAACGDDDDAADDTSAVTVAAAETAAPAATAAAADTATPAGTDGSTDTLPAVPTVPDVTLPGSGASPAQAADCQAVGQAVLEFEDSPPDPEVGEEISDEYKDAFRPAVEALEDLELETDEVQAAVDSLIDFGNQILDSDTWTEDIDAGAEEATTPLFNLCAATLAAMTTNT